MKTKLSIGNSNVVTHFLRSAPKDAQPFRRLLAGLGVVMACQLPTCADTLLGYNTSYPFPQIGAEEDVTFASSFTVGAQNTEIASMQFLLDGLASQPNDTTAYILGDSDGQPGAILGSSHRSFTIGELYNNTANGGFTIYSFANPVDLSAGKTYWAAFGYAGASVGLLYLSFTYNLNEFADNGITPSLSFATSGSYPPDQFTVNAPTQTLVYQLEGSVVPEPAPVALTFLGFATFKIRRMWKRPE
jgi:hypothetical protein